MVWQQLLYNNSVFVVDMKLSFVLGIEVLHRVHVQLDFEAHMLTLCSDNGSVTEVLESYK